MKMVTVVGIALVTCMELVSIQDAFSSIIQGRDTGLIERQQELRLSFDRLKQTQLAKGASADETRDQIAGWIEQHDLELKEIRESIASKDSDQDLPRTLPADPVPDFSGLSRESFVSAASDYLGSSVLSIKHDPGMVGPEKVRDQIWEFLNRKEIKELNAEMKEYQRQIFLESFAQSDPADHEAPPGSVLSREDELRFQIDGIFREEIGLADLSSGQDEIRDRLHSAIQRAESHESELKVLEKFSMGD